MEKKFQTLIEVSARHVHLSAPDLKKLFGPKRELKALRPVSQPGQYAAVETLKVVGPKGAFSKVRVVGPLRDKTQLEIAQTDAYLLGIKPKIRVSGDLSGTTGGVKLIGPRGQIALKTGVIIPQRHLHIEPALAKKYGLKHRGLISVKVLGKKSLTFHQVIVRSRPGIDKLSCQLDTDEGNAAGISGRGYGQVIIEK